MSRIALSDTGDWKLEFPDDQDIRGYRAVDANGAPVGVVDTMIVNTDEKRVDTIVLEDGAQYPARDISIGDGVVYLTVLTGDDVDEEVRVYDDGRVVQRVDVDGSDYDAHVTAFQTHHASSYGTGSYDDYAPAYRYGYETAHDDDYRNRAYVDAEDDLRTAYGTTYADRDFDADRKAVRYGYTRAQHATR